VKVVILAGGLGTRISEETNLKPKPMIEIGGKPILWHIMKIYSYFGINEFIICCGYKGYLIKEYFANYFLHSSDMTIDLVENETIIHSNSSEPWRVTLVDTGNDTMTGGRLKRVKNYLDKEDFCFTYGDGLSDINIRDLINFHKSHKKLATTTAVLPPGRFGSLELEEDKILSFKEKPDGDGSWINGGFFVLSPKVIDYIDNDQTIWERDPMERIASDNQMRAFFHKNFWQPMDTLRDKNNLEELWRTNSAPWRLWEK
jgi:glucose-1-phosphate cytidylyltransferase